ncbi:MAG: CDP-glucose 4,6-dehydratase [Bacteriovoracaceae bacterium]
MFKNIYKGKKVLITGHTGFKGTWLTTWLLDLGAEVFGISKDIPTHPSMFETLSLEGKIHHYTENLLNLDFVVSKVKEIKPDFVFHLAAQAIVSESKRNPVETFQTNVIGTTNVLEALRLSMHPCVAIIITSDKCYDNVEWVWGYKETDALGGKDIYSGSKGAAELVAKSYFHTFFKDSPVRIATVRAGNVIGGGDWALDRIVPDCIRAWSEKRKVTIRHPYATRPWQHVLEPISGYLTIGQSLYDSNTLQGEGFNFGPDLDANYTVQDILLSMAKLWGFSDPSTSYAVEESKVKFNEAQLLKLNCDKALFHMKWRPTLNYNHLIEFVSDWYVKFYKEKAPMYDFTIKQIRHYEAIAKEKNIQWALN